MSQRIVCWYSHGAASLVAAKKMIEINNGEKELLVCCIYLENECETPGLDEWVESFLGMPITYIKDEKYGANVDTVIEKTRYMSGVYGARCTKELKKQVRLNWQRHDDIHVFGMDCNEEDRMDRIIDAEPELLVRAPLVELGMSKKDCFTYLQKQPGFKLPKMYELGYHNNNCIGCLKASGAGYWNKIRKDFPEVFERRAKQEEMLNVALVKMSAAKTQRLHPETFEKMELEGYQPKIDSRNTMRIPLRFLSPDAGSHKDLDIGDCGFFCEVKE